MPYSDNSAVDVLTSGPPKAGPCVPASLMPYNRLLVVVAPVACSGSLTFEGSIDGGVTWYELALKSTETSQMVRTVTLGSMNAPRAYSLPMEDSSTSHFRVTGSPAIAGQSLAVTCRKENS